jgi:hypothetical protein
MRKLYVVKTRIGPFHIAEFEGRFHPLFRDESLGSYERPEQAAGRPRKRAHFFDSRRRRHRDSWDSRSPK